MAQEGNFTFPLFFLFFKYGILKLNMPIFFRASNIFKNKKTASLLAGPTATPQSEHLTHSTSDLDS